MVRNALNQSCDHLNLAKFLQRRETHKTEGMCNKDLSTLLMANQITKGSNRIEIAIGEY